MTHKLAALVMKINEDDSTMLVVTAEGDFWTVPLVHPVPAIGSSLNVDSQLVNHLPQAEPLPMKEAPSRQKNQESLMNKLSANQQWLTPVAACFILIFILGVNWLFFGEPNRPELGPSVLIGSSQPSPVSDSSLQNPATPEEPAETPGDTATYLVAVDFNPSIQLSLDQQLNFLAGVGINEDGKSLLTKAQLQPGDPLVLALQQLVVQARQDNYLSQEEENLILATVIKSMLDTQEDLVAATKTSRQVEDTLLLVLQAEQIPAQLSLRTGTQEELATAQEQQTSINKIYLISALAQQGIQVAPGQLEQQKLVHALKDLGVPPGQVIRHLRTIKDHKVGDQDSKDDMDLEEWLSEIRDQEQKNRDNKENPEQQENQPPGIEQKPPGIEQRPPGLNKDIPGLNRPTPGLERSTPKPTQPQGPKAPKKPTVDLPAPAKPTN